MKTHRDAQFVDVDDIKPADDNPRMHSGDQIDLIARSIQRFGFVYPILVSDDMEIIAGHGRWLAAKKIGIEKVPVIRAEGWSDEDIRAYRVIDNRLTELSDWSDELLRDYVDDLKVVGFSLEALKLDSLIKDIEMPMDDDEVEPVSLDTTDNTVICPKCGHEFEA